MKSFLTLTLIVSPVMVMADVTASTNALELIAGTARRALQTSADACTSALDQVKAQFPTDGSLDVACKTASEAIAESTATADAYKQVCSSIDVATSFGSVTTCTDYVAKYECLCAQLADCNAACATTGGTAGGAAAASAAPAPGTPTAAQGVVAIVQTIFFCVMGPIVLFYGPVVYRVVIFMQSLFASDYFLFINTFATITVPTIWDTVSKLVFLAAGTITLSFAAIRGEKIRGVLNGGTLGILVSVPLMTFISNILFVSWAKCTMDGAANKNFPNGSPNGCNQDELPFLLSFHLCKGFEWVIIFIFAKIGQAQIWVNISAAMAGATMFLDGVLDLVVLILGFVNPASVASTMIIMDALRTFLAYFIAAIGTLIQFNILETTKKHDGKKVTKLHDYGKAKHFNAFLQPPISHILKVLTFLDNIIMKAMEGKMKLAPGNSLNPAAMGEALKEMGGEMAEGVALKAAIKAAQPLLSPILAKIGLEYSDVEMIFNREITELEDAKEAASDPQAFLEKIWGMDKNNLVPKMMDKLSPKFESVLTKAHLTWDDVKDTVNEIIVGAQSLEEVIGKLADPSVILEHPVIKAKIEEAQAATNAAE